MNEIRVSYMQEEMWEIDEGKCRSVQFLKNLVASFQILAWTILSADTSGILEKVKRFIETNSKVCLFFMVSIAIHP